MGGHGGGAGELRVGVHTAHGVGHAVAGGAGGHVVRMQGAAGAAAGGHGEVLLPLLDAFLLIGAGHGMLEPGGVGELPVMDTSTPSACMMATPSRTSSAP